MTLTPRVAAAAFALAAAGVPAGPIVFENVVERSGVHFVMDNSASARKHQIETMISGVAIFDYNNDGLMDLYFVNGARLPDMDKSDRATGTASIATMATVHLPM